MIDRIFTFESTRVRQRAAPLLKEREAFLSHLYNSSTPIDRLKSVASTLILIVRFMELRSMRSIEPSEVEDAARRWCADPCRVRGKYPKSPRNFTTVAKRWFRFAGVISLAATVKSESETLLEEFHRYISIDRGFSGCVIRSYTERVLHFLLWAKSKQLAFADIGVCDLSDYLRYCSERGLKPRTTNGIVAALRAFFRYSAMLGLDTSRIARSIKYQTISRYSDRSKGPEWRDVRRLLDHGFGTTPSELRAAAIVSLSAIYAMRRCEIVRLQLSDIDWVSETITVRRGKSGKIQKFPLQFEVGQKILTYLRDGRAKNALVEIYLSQSSHLINRWSLALHTAWSQKDYSVSISNLRV